MAVAEIIGSAVGVLLLVIVAYILVGGTLSTAETVVTAQKDITMLQESRLQTHVSIDTAVISGDGTSIEFSIINDGNEPILELSHIDFFSYNTTDHEYHHYIYNSEGTPVPETWHVTSFEDAVIHSGQLDPGVTMHGIAILNEGDVPHNIQITTPNGVSAEKII